MLSHPSRNNPPRRTARVGHPWRCMIRELALGRADSEVGPASDLPHGSRVQGRNPMNASHIASRRDFLKGALAGAAVLRASAGAGVLAAAGQATPAAKSKVVIARDALLRGTGSTVDSGRMLKLLDRAMQALFDRDHPVEAWRKLVRPGETVGLKRSEEHTSELQSLRHLVCRLL